jgi:solute carrier family 50 protein (sugar transporter)
MISFLQVAPVISCQAMWLAPYPTIQKAIKDKSTGGLPPLGYFSMFANGYLWFGYGVASGMDLTIIVPNVTGMIAGCYYSYHFIQHNSGQFDLNPYYIGTGGAMAAVTGMLAFLPPDQAQMGLGYLGCAVVVAMFSGPLTVIKQVIETQSTRDLPFPMAVATVVNCFLWGSFGYFVIDDAFVWGPNTLGLASGLTQLALFAKYGFHTDDPEPAAAKEEEAKPASKSE